MQSDLAYKGIAGFQRQFTPDLHQPIYTVKYCDVILVKFPRSSAIGMQYHEQYHTQNKHK